MIVFIVGGSKSKKSFYGERIAEYIYDSEGVLYYLATMKPYDNEDIIRIEEHVKVREGHGYLTLEKEDNILDLIDCFSYNDTILLDSITSLVTNELFGENSRGNRVCDKIMYELSLLSKKVKNIVVVSDYLLSDGINYDKYTENFKREIGKLNCNIAEGSDVVIESSFGNVIFHKGKERINDEALK